MRLKKHQSVVFIFQQFLSVFSFQCFLVSVFSRFSVFSFQCFLISVLSRFSVFLFQCFLVSRYNIISDYFQFLWRATSFVQNELDPREIFQSCRGKDWRIFLHYRELNIALNLTYLKSTRIYTIHTMYCKTSLKEGTEILV